MKEIILTEKDHFEIKDHALQEWMARAATGDTFLSKCYISAILTFCKIKKYTIVDGKIYETEN